MDTGITENETAADAVIDAPAPADVAGEAVDATADLTDATAAAAPEAPAAPAFDPTELQAELEYLRQQNEQFAQIVQQAQQPAAAADAGGPPEYDPFDPDSVRAYMAWERQQTVNEMRQLIQPVSQTFQQQAAAQAAAEGEQRVQDILADDVARNGEFSTIPEADQQARQLVRTLADQMFPEITQKYGATARAAELAVSKAAEQVRGLLKAQAQAAVAQHENRVAKLAGVPGEPGSAAAGVVGQDAGRPLSAREIALKYASN